MNERASNYLRWAIVIGFLLVPPLLVRDFADTAPAVRMITDCLLIGVLTSMGLYLTFRRGDIVAEMPISKELKTERSRRYVGLFFRGLAALLAIAGISLAVSILPPMALYVLEGVPAVTEVHVVKQISSPAMPGAAYIYSSVLTDDKRDLSFSYPDTSLQPGHKYRFTLLPNSNFILTAELAE
jgi:hypothetical protein